MTLAEKKQRYASLMHAVQSGVMMKMELDGSETSPKHLRTGVNSALVGNGALVELLVKKGLITEEEYIDELVKMAEYEVAAYQKWLSAAMGTKVTLG